LKIANPAKRLSEAAKLLGPIAKCGETEKDNNEVEEENKVGNFCGS